METGVVRVDGFENEVDAFLQELGEGADEEFLDASGEWKDEDVEDLLGAMEAITAASPAPAPASEAQALTQQTASAEDSAESLPADPLAGVNAAEQAPAGSSKISQLANRFLFKLAASVPSPETLLPSPSSTKSSPPLRPSDSNMIAALEREQKRVDMLRAYRKRMQDESHVYSAAELSVFYRDYCVLRGVEPLQKFAQQLRLAERSGKPLVAVDLSNSELDGFQAECVAETLSFLGSLRRLMLPFTDLSDLTLQALLKRLFQFHRLQVLSIAGCWNISSQGLKYLSVYVRQSAALRFLDVSGIPFDMASISLFARALDVTAKEGQAPEGSAVAEGIEVLKMDGCRLQAPLLEELAPGVLKSKIRILSLRLNAINTEGSTWIAKLLQESTSLEKLDLSDNNLKITGLQRLTLALAKNTKLRELFLQKNDLEAVSLDLLAEVLKQNSTLELLDLSYNTKLCSSLPSVSALKEGLLVNRGLKSLLLADTGLKADGAIALAEALADNHSLERLCLLENDGALNPFRANLLNLGHLVVSQGRVALKNFGSLLQERFQQTRGKSQNGSTESISSAAGAASATTGASGRESAPPLPSEAAFAALMAFGISMRMNTTMKNLELLEMEEKRSIQPISSKQASSQPEPSVASKVQTLSLIAEIRSLCARNAGVQDRAGEHKDGQPSASTTTLVAHSMSSVHQQVNSAQQTLLVVRDILRFVVDAGSEWSEKDKQTLKTLHEELVRFQAKIPALLTLDLVVQNERLSDRIQVLQSELRAFFKQYADTFSVDAREVEPDKAIPSPAVNSVPVEETKVDSSLSSPLESVVPKTSATYSLDDDEESEKGEEEEEE